jgi:hypothetical protein
VSKKTIAFTMPAAGRGPGERAPVVLDGLTGERVAFAAAEESLREAGIDGKTDEWVRDRPSRGDAGLSLAPEPPAMRAPTPGVATIDLAAERNLMEAMMLSFIVPVALGWFWFAHAMARRQRLWGV